MEIKEQLLGYLKLHEGIKSPCRQLPKRNPELWAKICEVTSWLETTKHKQRCWHVLNDIWSIPLCPTDNVPLKWFDNRYLTFSSQSAKCRNFDHTARKVKVQHKRKEIKTGRAVDERERYRDRAKRLTHHTVRKYKDKIINYHLRGLDFHLDHKFSIDEGLKHGVPPEIIAHWANLEIIPAQTNRKKNAKCSITLAELLEVTSANHKTVT